MGGGGKDAERALLAIIDLCQRISIRANSLVSIGKEENRDGIEILALPVTQGSARPSKFGSLLSCFRTPHESAV